MVKSIITVIMATFLVVAGTIYEQIFVRVEFKEFNVALVELYDKVENETASKSDVVAFEKFWLKKKETLHIFIPHNDIKEIDLWVGETITFVEELNYKEARSKLQVLKLLAEEIPKTFMFRLENIL